MKQLLISFSLLIICNSAMCQWTTSGTDIYTSNTGNVGIGNSSPSGKLDVNGNIAMTGNAATRMIWNTGYGGAVQLLRSDATSTRWARIGIVDGSGTWLGGIHISNDGNVGINTTSPTSKLDVNGDITMAANATIRTIWNSGYGGGMQLLRSDASSTRWARLGIVDASCSWVGGIHVSNDINVGIGTTLPTEKLSVEGNISANGTVVAKKIKITQTGWSDYVFNDNYKLLSLHSLESFIKLNKHLPDVPSAKEVEADGISVGDNQSLLLKKIEELTLYLIEMNKRNDIQQKEINSLNKKLLLIRK